MRATCCRIGSLLFGGAAVVGVLLWNTPTCTAFLHTPQAPILSVRHRVVTRHQARQPVVGVQRSSEHWGLRAVDTDELERTKQEGVARPLTEAEKLQLKAEMLRLQAEKLRLEADRDQIKMERETMLKKQVALQEIDRVIGKFRDAQSEEELQSLVRIYIRQIDGDVMMRFRELGGAAEAPEQRLAYRNLSDRVMQIMETMDKVRAKEVRDDVAYRLKDEAKDATDASQSSSSPMAAFDQFGGVQDNMRNQTLMSIDQLTQEMMRNNSRGFSPIYAINLPQWLPREFMRMLESFEPLAEEDVRTLRTEVFKMDTFFVTDVDRTPLAVAYMGTLRKDSEQVFNSIQKRLQATEGLKDRVQLFLFENPRPQMQEGMVEGEPQPEVMFMAVSSRVKPLAVGGGQITLSLLSALATGFNCFIYSILTFYTPNDIVNKLAQDPLARLSDALPIAAGIIGIQFAHDIAHSVAASARNVTLGVPVYVPSLQIGTFGSILRFASFPKNRNDMFDVSMAGPLVGTLLSFVAYAVGMSLTQGAAADVSAQWPMLPVALFRSSLLLWQVGQALFSPDVINLPLASQIHVHPLAIVGAMGLLSQALQAMPIGRLDGGRATTSVFGRKAATFLSASLVLYQVISGVLLGNTLQLFWGTVVIIFQNAQEMYARDEITPVDDRRRLLLIGLWAIAFLVLLPGVPWKDVGFDDLSMYI